jgi:hypothetical protein
MGFGLVNGFIDHLHTPLETTSNYSVIAKLQIITVPVMPFSGLLCLHQQFLGNGFLQCRFFSFTHSDPIFTASRTELNSQLTTDN